MAIEPYAVLGHAGLLDPDVVVNILRHHPDDLTRFRVAALGWR